MLITVAFYLSLTSIAIKLAMVLLAAKKLVISAMS